MLSEARGVACVARWTGLGVEVLVLVVVAAGALAGDAWPPLVVANLGRWWLLAGAGIVGCALLAARSPLMAVPGLLAGCLALAALWPLVRTAQPTGDALVVVAYNVERAGNSAADRYENVAGIVRDVDPDVVLLEQVNGGLADLLAAGELLPYARVSAPDEIDDRTAVISRVPITDARSVTTPGRSTSVVTLATDAGALQVVPLHLTSPCYLCWDALTDQAATRVDEVEKILDTLEPGPAIIGGDLNSGPGNDAAGVIRGAGFSDAHVTGGEGLGLTRPVGALGFRIDMLFGRGWRAVRTLAGDARGSDHRPVVAAFEREAP